MMGGQVDKLLAPAQARFTSPLFNNSMSSAHPVEGWMAKTLPSWLLNKIAGYQKQSQELTAFSKTFNIEPCMVLPCDLLISDMRHLGNTQPCYIPYNAV